MTATALLDELRTKGVHLTVEGQHVAVDAPKGVLTDALRQAIRQHKQALLAFLAQPVPAPGAAATPPRTPERCPPQGHVSSPRPRTPAVQWARHFVQATRSGSTDGMTIPHGLTPP